MPAAGAGEMLLDPFGYLPHIASRLEGLGGSTPGHDFTYVFHTSYVEVAPGPAHFTVSFTGLRAKRGTVTLRVHMLRMEEGAHATLVSSERIRVNRLVAYNGLMSVRFEGFRGMHFAFVATISEDSDATADGVTVTLDRPVTTDIVDDEVAIEAKSTAYGTKAVRPAARLVALGTPRLAEPASQIGTTAQLAEPAFREAATRLGPIAGTSADEWQAAYVYQALKRYGMIEAGARGVGFGVEDGPLPAVLAAAGVTVLATDIGAPAQEGADADAALAHLARPTLCDAASFARNVTRRDIWLSPIPRDLVNYDFLWSIGAADRLGTIAAGLAFIEEAMICLRPGGLAVHTVAFDPDGARQVVDGGRTPPFVRPDLERLALNLVSRGHEVAQIRIDNPFVRGRRGDRMLPAFGLIARRAAAPY